VNAFRPVEKLRQDHEVGNFDCGKEALNRFLIRHAWNNQQANSAQTYVSLRDGVVSGYYTLVAASVSYEAATARVRKGLARHAVPVILLARLAVAKSAHGQGVGAALLKDALIRSAGAATTIGARALLVHAKDEEAREFYEHFSFDPSPSDPFHLFLLMKDLQRWVNRI
jgi:GNAT superfamily N-acetyltransferase